MDRNPNQRTRDGGMMNRDEERFSRLNPPKSEEEAQRKLEQLADDISHIEADLEHKEVESFPNEADYEIWRKRAISALGYKKSELKFLETWMKQFAEAKVKASHDATVQHYKERVAASVQRFSTVFKTVHGFHAPVGDAVGAQARLDVLVKAVAEIEKELSELNEFSMATGLTHTEAAEAKKPLAKLLKEGATEIYYLRDFLRVSMPSDGRNVSTPEQTERAQRLMDFARNKAEEIARERGQEYSPALPPPDRDVAEQRRVLLGQVRIKIQSALSSLRAMAQTSDVGSPLALLRKPLAELLHAVEEEAVFLKAFIANEKTDPSKPKTVVEIVRLPTSLDNISSEIRKRAQALAKEIGATYSTVYTAENPPHDAEEAKKRQASVIATKARLQKALGEISDAWVQHPLRREDLSSVKRPLVGVLESVESELRILKSYFSEQGIPLKKNRRWKSLCVKALTRAALAGFKLLPEEQEMLEELLLELTNESEDRFS